MSAETQTTVRSRPDRQEFLQAPVGFADPIVTANVYGRDALDGLVSVGILPFWRSFVQSTEGEACRLWLMRYGKGGEHLKVRLHGPDSIRAAAEELLERAIHAAWNRLPDLPHAGESRWRGAPPVDAENQVSDDHPDRTLLWTTYRRSPVSLGGKPWIDDDRYVEGVTRCLSSSCERTLELFATHQKLPDTARQNLLIELIGTGLAALGWGAGQRSRYLSYHRGSLFRFLLLKSEHPEEKAEKLLARCDRHAASLGASRGALEEFLGQWRGEAEGTAWQRELRHFYDYISTFKDSLDHRLDPFAEDVRFTPLFKVFHGAANQLGLTLLNEGFTHHLLLSIERPEPPPLQLLPSWSWLES